MLPRLRELAPPPTLKAKGSACGSLLTTTSSRNMPVGTLRAENSGLSLLVEALHCAFLGVGLILEEEQRVAECAHALFSNYTQFLLKKNRALYIPCITV